MRLADIVAASADVAATRSRLRKVARLAEVMRALEPEERGVGLSFLAGRPRQETLGVGWATVRNLDAGPAEEATLELLAVDAILEAVANASGPGSNAVRHALLDEMFAAATAEERDFLKRLILRELRQGATEGLTLEAIAAAAGVEADAVRRAAMIGGDLVAAGEAALTNGADGLAGFRLELLRPIQPMLAQSGADVGAAMQTVGVPASVEAKLDGARIQVHRLGDEVRIFTRNLRDATARLPEMVAIIRSLPHRSLVLDGEAVAMGDDARPLAFQSTMARFGTEARFDTEDGAAPARSRSLRPFFFDVLHLDGVDLLDEPAAIRWEALSRLPAELLVERVVTASVEEAGSFLADTLAAGHEGVMVKSTDAPYAAGRRGSAWLKVKPVHTLDLVVLAVEWGSGRRKGWLSNLHLGAADPEGGFVMLGKTFKGMTDEMLAWQTERFQELETTRSSHVVTVRPEQVVEIAFDGVQRSTRYPGGVALRFARVVRYRPDKKPHEADTIDTVRSYLP